MAQNDQKEWKAKEEELQEIKELTQTFLKFL